MALIENPALNAFVAQIQPELILAQVVIRRTGSGYSLCHRDDREADAANLTTGSAADARTIALNTAAGEFRPLKCAPTLKTGWHILARNDAELEIALAGLYPGAIPDWFAAQKENPPVTHYREYADRQTGMFRITGMLTEAQAAPVITETCAAANCLKRRLWTATGLAADSADAKSLVPCLEPCAILMENARKAARARLPPKEKKPEA